MKKSTMLFIGAAAVTVMLCLCPSYIYTETSSPAAGNTGAPGEQSCNQSGCHTGNPVNLEAGKLTLGSLGSPSISSGYAPNGLYNLYVNLSSGTPRYGFQITALDQNNNSAGTFTITDVNKTQASSLGGRQYVGHKNASSNNAWSFRWQAPATDIGQVTFYFTGCGANNDADKTGDVIYRGRATATTSVFSQLDLTGMKPINADEEQALKIYPNPFSEQLSVEYFLHDENRVKIELFSTEGKLVKHLDECVDFPGFYQRHFAFEEKMQQGIYVLRITEGEKTYFKKLMAQ